MKMRRNRRLTCPIARRVRRVRMRMAETSSEVAALLSTVADSLKAFGEHWHRVAIGAIVVYAIAGPTVKAATSLLERLTLPGQTTSPTSARHDAAAPSAQDARKGYAPEPASTTGPPRKELDCPASPASANESRPSESPPLAPNATLIRTSHELRN